jgi:hypothetical protein
VARPLVDRDVNAISKATLGATTVVAVEAGKQFTRWLLAGQQAQINYVGRVQFDEAAGLLLTTTRLIPKINLREPSSTKGMAR